MHGEEDDILGCDSCTSEALLAEFNDGAPDGKRNLCKICATTHIGCKTRYPTISGEHFAEVEMYKIIAQVGNVIIQELKENL